MNYSFIVQMVIWIYITFLAGSLVYEEVYTCMRKNVPLLTDIARAWLDTLLDVIDLLPKDVLKKDVSTSNL